MDTVNPTIRTERWLHLDLAVITVSAGDGSVPEDFVPYFKGVSVNIPLFSIHLHNLSRAFVAEDAMECACGVRFAPEAASRIVISRARRDRNSAAGIVTQ